MEREQIRDLMLYHLRNSFSLFDKSHRVNVPKVDEGNVCVNYRTTVQSLGKLMGTTHFDIQAMDGTCYLLWIELELEKRGKGFGWQLYETVHNFARDFGCKRVRTTPSGWAFGKETRREYLLKRGYAPCGEREVEFILV